MCLTIVMHLKMRLYLNSDNIHGQENEDVTCLTKSMDPQMILCLVVDEVQLDLKMRFCYVTESIHGPSTKALPCFDKIYAPENETLTFSASIRRPWVGLSVFASKTKV